MNDAQKTIPAALTRRRFLTAAGAAALAAQAQRLHRPIAQHPRFAYVAAIGKTNAIHVYATALERWKLRQTIAAEAPVSLVLHPAGHTLYALHEVGEHAGLPRGYVEAYRVEPNSGYLKLLMQQPLSLSATYPRHLAISPDGQTLAAAVHGGGAYNLLPLDADGHIGRVYAIHKETGSGPVTPYQNSAHPQAILFDAPNSRTTPRIAARIVAIDQGKDTVTVFSAGPQLHVLTRHSLPPGSGPSHVALHPDGRFLFVSNALSGSLLSLGYDQKTATISRTPIYLRGFGGPLAIHAASNTLYAANQDRLTACRIELATGALRPVQQLRLASQGDPAEVRNLVILPQNNALFAVTDAGIVRIEIDASSGYLGLQQIAAPMPGARAIAFA